jgi:gas vesicle protein
MEYLQSLGNGTTFLIGIGIGLIIGFVVGVLIVDME